MSGIAGIVRFDGQAVDLGDIAAISHALKHRGPAKTQLIDHGLLLAFGGTVEADDTAGIYAVTDADVFPPHPTDQFFSQSYTQHGAASFNEINADFAVALWDARRQILVCARDSVGVKPLYYVHRPEHFFAFATEIKVLLALQEVAVVPNQHKFREYLTWTTTYVPYSAETFYETILSVLPGHYLQVDAQTATVTPYWQPDLTQFNSLNGVEAWSDLFNDYFTAAIDARISGKTSVGAHLSGGLDSSSVSCVAQHLLGQQNRRSLHTFNIDTGLASTDESAYVQAVIEQCHPEHHVVHPVSDVLESILKINHLFDRPEHFIIPSSFHLSVSVAARQLGCECILTGHDGDSVIATCFEYLDQLIDKADWNGLQLACQQVASHPEHNLLYVNSGWQQLSGQDKIEQYALYILGSGAAKRFRRQSPGDFMATLRQQKQLFRLSTESIMAYCMKRIRAKLAYQRLIDSAFTTEFTQRVPLRPQLSTQGLTTRIMSESHVPVDQILNTTNVICNEQLNHIGSCYGHQYSFPFFDKRVIELGLATPLQIGFDRGRGRGLIRNGLKAKLPPAVVSRLTKTNFVEYSTLSAQQLYTGTHEQFTSTTHAIWGIIDRATFSTIVAVVFNPKIPVQKKSRYNWLLSRIIYLALWLGSLPKGN